MNVRIGKTGGCVPAGELAYCSLQSLVCTAQCLMVTSK